LNLHGAGLKGEDVVLSIITISFNDLPRLQKTVRSLQQSNRRVEHVLVVPTTDLETREWLKSNRSDNGPKQTVLSDEGLGIYQAMNLGVSGAAGKYICFWNSGDMLFDLANLQELVIALDAISDPWLICLANLEWAEKNDYSSTSMLRFLLSEPKQFISHQAVFINRSALEKMGGFNLKYRVAADTELLMRCHQKFGEPRLFEKVVVDVQTPQFASYNNRRSRYEVFKISILRVQPYKKHKAVFNLLKREILGLLHRLLVLK
jgi:glycosyltransferase involved in cell wall biosynthesis